MKVHITTFSVRFMKPVKESAQKPITYFFSNGIRNICHQLEIFYCTLGFHILLYLYKLVNEIDQDNILL